ncbi:hypothetical protein JW905_12845 [bacterium]|nr:hypothetical protein [candidate division CSSED10-310 bacterium]
MNKTVRILCACGIGIILIFIIVARLPHETHDDSLLIRAAGGDDWTIQYGVDGDVMVYLAMVRNEGPEGRFPQPLVITQSEHRDYKRYITHPDGEPRPLPEGANVLQLLGGELTTATMPITLDEVTGFLDSQPEAYTIETLRAFLSARP